MITLEGHTHAIAGLLAGLGIYSLAPHLFGSRESAVIIAAASALVADMDHPGSLIHRIVPVLRGVQRGAGGLILPYRPPALGQRRVMGRVGVMLPGGKILWHREETHSFAFAGGIALAAGTIGLFWKGAGFFLPTFLLALAGSISHLALDRFNRSKEYLLWPFRRGPRGHVQDWWPHFGTGGIGETLLFLVLLIPLLRLTVPAYVGGLFHFHTFATFLRGGLTFGP